MSINKFILMIGLVLVSFSAVADEGASQSTHNWRGFYAGGFMGGTVSTQGNALLCGASSGVKCNSPYSHVMGGGFFLSLESKP